MDVDGCIYTSTRALLQQLPNQALAPAGGWDAASDALDVDDAGARYVVLLLRDPHLCEGAERREDGAADPHRVLPLRRCGDRYLHRVGHEGPELLLHTRVDPRVHRGASGEDYVLVQVLADVNVGLHDRVEGCQVDARECLPKRLRVEKCLGAAETLLANGDHITIGELVGLLQVLVRLRHLCFEVKGNIGEPLLDVTHDLLLGVRHKGVAAFCEELDHVLRHVPAGQVQAENGVRQCEALVDGHRVCDTITGVQHETRCPPGGIQGEHCLDLDVHLRHVECLKHDLRHSLAVRLGVHWGLGQQDRVLLRCHAQLAEEGVLPNLLHVIPARDNTVLDGVIQSEHTSDSYRFITHVELFGHSAHDVVKSRAADNGREHSPWGIITSKSSLDHPTAIVTDQRCGLAAIIQDGPGLRGPLQQLLVQMPAKDPGFGICAGPHRYSARQETQAQETAEHRVAVVEQESRTQIT